MPRFKSGDSHYGMTVVEVLEASTIKATSYLVRHACCGVEKIRSHQSLFDRVRKGRGACTQCEHARATASVYRVGDARGGVTILWISDHALAHDRRYRLRYDCCGAIREVSSGSYTSRLKKHPETCGACRSRGKAAGAPKSLAAPYGIMPPTWPKPPGVPGGRWVWGQA